MSCPWDLHCLWYSLVSTFLNQSDSPTFGKLAQKNVQVYKRKFNAFHHDLF